MAVPATVCGERLPNNSTGMKSWEGMAARLIHKPGYLPSRRLSAGRVNHVEADLRVGDNLAAVHGDCQS